MSMPMARMTFSLWVNLGLTVLLLAATPTPGVHPVAITSPQDGASVQGRVTIEGRTAVPDFRMAVLEYQALPKPGQRVTPVGWLPITVLTQSTVHGWLADWDTSTLPPGPYALRLRVETSRETLSHQITLWVGMPAPKRPGTTPTPVATTAPPWAQPTPRPWPTPIPVQPIHTAMPIRHVSWQHSLTAGIALGIALVALYLALNQWRW